MESGTPVPNTPATDVLTAGVDALLASSAKGSGPRSVLDLGGGTGGQAVRLAHAGHSVTVVDPSLDALAALGRRGTEAGVSERLTAVQGDAETLHELLPADSVDLVLCHGVLEVVDDPVQCLRSIGTVLRPDGRLSLLVHQREAGVLYRVATGQIRAAASILRTPDGRWGAGDPLQRRLSAGEITSLLAQGGFVELDREGVRTLSDLAPDSATVADPSLVDLLTGLDTEASRITALRDVAMQLHVHARPA